MRLMYLPLDRAIDALEILDIPHYTNDCPFRASNDITHFKRAVMNDHQLVIVIWDNDEPTPTDAEITSMIDENIGR